jgi:cytoskeletal protein CcmA (bactofilin family)
VFGIRPSHPHRIDALIGAGTRIDGDIAFTGGLRIDGEVRGDVIAAPGEPSVLVIGEHGRVQGKVRAERMVVSGVLSGSIHAAELLEVHSSARISGELRYGALEVHPGARLEVTLACEAPPIATVAADTRLPERAEALLLPAPRAA